MQIDFHHGVTYALARIAGFSSEEAAVVAYSSQYVDDAVETGMISFLNGSAYARISSAHKMLDYRNFQALADHLVWLPFHFLPGNAGLPAGEEPEGPFIRKLVCVPNSPVAQDMIKSIIRDRDRAYALHRLGIAMHVYADTWAHQGFAGFPHEINHATDVTGPDGSPDLRLKDKLTNYFLNAALPLGHGTVLSNPDKPYLVWAYTNGLGERVTRDNPSDFLDAAEHMVRAMQCFRAGAWTDDVPGLPPADSVVIQQMLREVVHADENERHRTWLYQIEQGAFSFGPDRTAYVGEGEGSWKHEALGVSATSDDGLAYRPEFLKSHWKRFHDALQAQRFDVLHHILPEYGICAA